MRKKILGIFVIVISSLLLTAFSFADTSTTLRLNQTSSFIFVSPWYVNYEDIDQNSVEKYPISGDLTLFIDDSIPDLLKIRFEAFDIATPSLPSGPFNFPDYYGDFDGTDFFGNGNPCSNWSGSGTCWSMGNFGYYSGTFNGESLSMMGSSPIDFDGSYYFSIQASVAPEPISYILFIAGGMLLAGRKLLERGRS